MLVHCINMTNLFGLSIQDTTLGQACCGSRVLALPSCRGWTGPKGCSVIEVSSVRVALVVYRMNQFRARHIPAATMFSSQAFKVNLDFQTQGCLFLQAILQVMTASMCVRSLKRAETRLSNPNFAAWRAMRLSGFGSWTEASFRGRGTPRRW